MVLFSPVDLPKIEAKENIARRFTIKDESFNFGFQKLTNKTADPYAESRWSPEALEHFSDLVHWIDSYIPYEKLVNVKIVSAVGPIKSHIDFEKPELAPELYKHTRDCEPCGYRLVLKEPGTKNLYVEREGGERVHVTMPDSTDAYVLSHTGTLHSLDPLPAPGTRITVFIHAWMKTDRHREVIERSVSKYSAHVIYR